ncbi:MAG: T9SS type A sorting domain-containing protein, partial [Bacteroidetes bacterium]|nr:T9SS type A sorting domain-containing protein [Bacteroidota bacterium]
GVHDVVINCDMLETGSDEVDNGRGTFKAIVWDNGERFNTTGGIAESWLYVEDHVGHVQMLSLGMNIKQPDVVIANDIDRRDANTPDFIVGIVYVEESPALGYIAGMVMMRTYGVYNAGTPGMVVALLQQVKLGKNPSNTAHGNVDGNPHIDMWTNTGYLVSGLPSLREFAVCWSEGYQYQNCYTPPNYSYTKQPGNLMYSWGDINNIGTAFSNVVNTKYLCNGMSDIACYYNAEAMQQYSVITFGSGIPCVGEVGLYANEDIPKTTAIFPAGNLVVLNNDPPKVTRVEAMNQYDQSAGLVSKWVVAASMPQVGAGFPWEVWSYDDRSNVNPLSANYTGSSADVVSPAVAAGVSPTLSGNIGNRQYTTGYYPRDYNTGTYHDIWSRSVDVFSGLMSGTELQVNNAPVNIYWDINRIYAVSNCSNSGFNILSAYFNGNEILYKESPNAFYYKPSGTTTVKTIGSRTMIGLYPNPAHNMVYLSHAAGKEYRLMDITGKTVLSGQYTTSGVDITTLTCGFYMLNIKDSEGKQISFKFTKQ